MESSNETKKDMASSNEFGLLTRIKFECVPIVADMIAYHCTNPHCSCKTVTLVFFEANDQFDKRLFILVVNYETWQIESSEVLNHDMDYAEIITEFMGALDDPFKTEILSGIGPKAQREHTLRNDINLSEFVADSMVCYSEIYQTEQYEDLVFGHEGKVYYVLDHYCPRPKCECKDVVLSFYLVDEGEVKDAPILAYKVKFETARGTIEDKSADVSMRFAKDLYRGLLRIFGGAGMSFFENRYNKIKEWGAIHLSAKVAPVKTTASKTGRNDPCPCGSGKKNKKCCGF